jgi:hypothetical protein
LHRTPSVYHSNTQANCRFKQIPQNTTHCLIFATDASLSWRLNPSIDGVQYTYVLYHKPTLSTEIDQGASRQEKRKQAERERSAFNRAMYPDYYREWVARRGAEAVAMQRAARDKWRKSHPEMISASASSRRSAKLNRTVSWDRELTDLVTKESAHLCRLREAATGIKWHVDHEVPLRGKSVSGLHVWNNLSVIPAVENVRKGNRFV